MSTKLSKYGTVMGTFPAASRQERGPIALPGPNPMNLPIGVKSQADVALTRAERSVHTRSVRRKLGSYSPNNPTIYNAAINGFLSGVFFGREMVTTESEDDAIVAESNVFAQAMDSAIPAGTVSDAQKDLVLELSQSVTAYKYVTGLPMSAFSAIGQAIAACYNVASPTFAATSAPGAGPWTQTGETITANDQTASVVSCNGAIDDESIQCFLTTGGQTFNAVTSFAASGGTVSDCHNAAAFNNGALAGGDYSFACSGGAASGNLSCAGAGGTAGGDNSAAFAEGVTAGQAAFAVAVGTANGENSFASCEATANGYDDGAFGQGSVADSQESTEGQSSAFAICGGTSTGGYAFACGLGSAAGPADNCVALAGGTVTSGGSVAIGPCTVTNSTAFKLGDDAGALVSINDDGEGTLLLQLGASQALSISNTVVQTGAGLPTGTYIVLTINEVEYAIALNALS